MSENPFVISQPVQLPTNFFGRKQTKSWLIDELQNSTTNVLLISGSRGIGKSSLLLNFAADLPAEEYKVVYLDLLLWDKRPLADLLAYFTEAMLGDCDSKPSQTEPPDTIEAWQTAVFRPMLETRSNRCL